MATNEHTREQGLRVHHLANLGGLVAVAGLDREPPDFLLGTLISVAHEVATLTAEQRGWHLSVVRSSRKERRPNARGSRGAARTIFIR